MGKSRRSKYTNRFGKQDNQIIQRAIEESKAPSQFIAGIELQPDPVVLQNTECVTPQDITEVVLLPSIIVEEDPTPEPIVEEKVLPKPKPRQVSQGQNVLNSLLTVILTNEYQRLHQQLLQIKRQLDANNIQVDSISDKDNIDI